MKLILRADIEKLGNLGEVVEVKPGYGRNYLIPQGLAMLASPANLKVFETERKKLQAKMDQIRFAAQELADKIAAATVIITVRVGENDKLYGAVTSANIADALTELGIDLDRRKIEIEQPIRALGEYEIEVKLHHDVRGLLKVSVRKHGAQIEASAEKPAESGTAQAEESA